MLIDLGSILKDFMSSQLDIDIYNEISLQLELGLFLRKRLYGQGYKVMFEKNIYDIRDEQRGFFVKSEMDIFIEKGMERHAIELKYPKNGMYPEEMYEFLKDIRFTEQLKETAGFISTHVLTLVDYVFQAIIVHISWQHAHSGIFAPIR